MFETRNFQTPLNKNKEKTSLCFFLIFQAALEVFNNPVPVLISIVVPCPTKPGGDKHGISTEVMIFSHLKQLSLGRGRHAKVLLSGSFLLLSCGISEQLAELGAGCNTFSAKWCD